MAEAFICDAIRTPIGRYGGGLRQGAHRRSRRDPHASELIGAQSEGRLVEARRSLSTAAPIRPARIIATSRAWRCCSRAFRRMCQA